MGIVASTLTDAPESWCATQIASGLKCKVHRSYSIKHYLIPEFNSWCEYNKYIPLFCAIKDEGIYRSGDTTCVSTVDTSCNANGAHQNTHRRYISAWTWSNPERIELHWISTNYLYSSPQSPGSSLPFFTIDWIKAMSPSSRPAHNGL